MLREICGGHEHPPPPPPTNNRFNLCFLFFLRSGPGASVSTKVTDDATVHGLRCELERCLLSNKEKRIQVSNLQEDLRKLKREFGEYRIRCERSEKTAEEYKVL